MRKTKIIPPWNIETYLETEAKAFPTKKLMNAFVSELREQELSFEWKPNIYTHPFDNKIYRCGFVYIGKGREPYVLIEDPHIKRRKQWEKKK
jgi:hypothetical protein